MCLNPSQTVIKLTHKKAKEICAYISFLNWYESITKYCFVVLFYFAKIETDNVHCHACPVQVDYCNFVNN